MVYRGVHVHDPELVAAIKVVQPALATDTEFVTALRKECRVLMGLGHRNIVGFRDLVLSDAHPPAMVMELLDGEDLNARLARGQLAPPEAFRVLMGMLEALSFAHKKGVVHRDVKPGNVLVCHDQTVKVVDFGIARAADESHATKTGVLTGTLDYMAPEVWSGDCAGPAADIYATGLVAWQLLVGRSPVPSGP